MAGGAAHSKGWCEATTAGRPQGHGQSPFLHSDQGGQAAHQPPPHQVIKRLLLSKDRGRHLPRGLRAAATLSPTFLRKFTLGSSDGPAASRNKKPKNEKCSIQSRFLNDFDTCDDPNTFLTGALHPRESCPGSLPALSPALGPQCPRCSEARGGFATRGIQYQPRSSSNHNRIKHTPPPLFQTRR